MSYKLSAELNRYRQRVGIYETLEMARSKKAEILAKYPYSKPKIVQV